jgi:1-acyl-sn-glycerol-3-phosphate acyltransferase
MAFKRPAAQFLRAPHQPFIILTVRAKLMGYFLLGLIRVLTGAQARWWGCPPKAEQRIYFANHQSHADLVMIWAALPKELRHGTRAVAARDYWTRTKFKQWITSAVFNVIYVSRERHALEDPLEPLIDALNAGDSLILFPEGTRGHADEPQAFKAGLYNLALKFPQIELIPAWIANVQRVMPKGEVVPVPVLCSVTFGVPMRLQSGEDRAAFLQRARSAVIALRDI